MSTTKMDDGGPAFPLIACVNGAVVGEVGGMSLRDWFAGQAFVAIDANQYDHFSDVASDAYAIADAMLAARKFGAPAPSVNAELLAACKKFVDGGECYCHELDANSKPCGVCAAIAAIVRAEKGGVA